MRHTRLTESRRYDEPSDREASPSAGYRHVFYHLDCARPDCNEQGFGEYPPDVTTHVCENHTLEEFEEIAEVKVRA